MAAHHLFLIAFINMESVSSVERNHAYCEFHQVLTGIISVHQHVEDEGKYLHLMPNGEIVGDILKPGGKHVMHIHEVDVEKIVLFKCFNDVVLERTS